MNKKSRLSIWIAVIAGILGAVLLAVLMNVFLEKAMISRQAEASREKLTLIDSMLDDMESTEEAEREAFDELNISKADTIAFMASQMSDFSFSDKHMSELRKIIDVYDLIIVDSDGEIICSALESADTKGYISHIKEVWEGSKAADPFTVENDDLTLRFYASKIDYSHMAVIVRNTEVLNQKINDLASLNATLDGVKVGQEGFAFAISADDHTLLYYPDESLIGTKASDCGIDESLIGDGTDGYVTINGKSYYCSTALLHDKYIVCAVPESELLSNRNLTILISLLIYLITALIMILYAGFNACDTKSRNEEGFGKIFAGRLFAITIVGALCAFFLTYLFMTLFSLSRQSITNSHRLDEAIESIKASEDENTYIDEQFDESYLEKASLLARIIEESEPEALTQEFMASLADKLKVKRASYFGTDGNIVASSDTNWGLTLSSDESDQTYEFRRILEGSCDNLVQAPMLGDDGEYYQYVGVAICDDDHRVCGLAQIGIAPSMLELAHSSANLDDVLSDIQTGNNGFVFAVDDATHIFTYYPDDALTGGRATDYGLEEEQLISGYNDLIKVNNVTYYSESGKYGDNLIFVAVPMNTLNNLSLPIAVVAGIFCFVWMLILWAILNGGIGTTVEAASGVAADAAPIDAGETEASPEMINVDRGDGKNIRTRSILTRFSNSDVSWEEHTPWQKVCIIFKIIIGVVALCLLLMLIFADSLFSSDSIIHFILKGNWQKGFNIFAVVQCLILIIAVEVISIAVRKLLMWFSGKLEARGNTLIRLLVSFIKLATMIGLIYACLSELGADTSVLLTSAGILSLVVGLGANSLIKDILAGLMIVFEGSFQVGDIVTINGFRGTVIEIGIRTTKVKEGGGNIKVFNNSSVGDVLNMTKDFSIVSVDMSIEYGEDLRYVENVLADEFPAIKEALPAIKDGPFYKGVSELGDNSVNLKIVAKCAEADRVQLDRDLKRELKLIFDKYNISIPFPQVVINEPPTSFHSTSLLQDETADEFTISQSEASQDVYIETEDN